MRTSEPIFNVPGMVLALIAVFIAVHAARLALHPQDAEWWLLALAFIPARYAGFAGEIPGGNVAGATSFVSHMFLHADWFHLAINSAWMAAFGSVLNRRMGALRFLMFALGGGVAGALLFLIVNPGLAAPVIGASGAVAAMMGGVMCFLFNAIDARQGYLLRDDPAAIPRMTFLQIVTDRRIVISSLVFVGINLLALIGFGQLGEAGAIAWEAHLGGYFYGLFAFALFDAAPQKASPYGGEAE
ncbi:MAG: rhomboid family intramembrane serine protease [Hyphomicrobium sp.]|nr:rhomboid family intramembrane serine protease [Hyphomicrobium sp.]